jgi:hypothetical protein
MKIQIEIPKVLQNEMEAKISEGSDPKLVNEILEKILIERIEDFLNEDDFIPKYLDDLIEFEND